MYPSIHLWSKTVISLHLLKLKIFSFTCRIGHKIHRLGIQMRTICFVVQSVFLLSADSPGIETTKMNICIGEMDFVNKQTLSDSKHPPFVSRHISFSLGNDFETYFWIFVFTCCFRFGAMDSRSISDKIGVGIPCAIAMFNTRLPHLSNISSSFELADISSKVVSHTFKQSSAINSLPRPPGGRMNENLCLNLGILWNN